MRVRNAVFGTIGVLWGGAMVVVGFRHGLAYDSAYELGRVGAYLFGWVMVGAGVAALRSHADPDIDLY